MFCYVLIITQIGEKNDSEKYCCDAFPDGIPLEKINWDEDEECNNGIKYEEKCYLDFVE